MRKLFLSIVIILLIGLVITEIMLPRYFAEQVETALRHEVQRVDTLEVKISTHPALLLLSGRVHNSSLKATGVEIDQLRIDKLEAWYEDLEFTKTPQGTITTGGTNVYFQADILQDDLNKYLKAVLSQFDFLEVELQNEKATIHARLGSWVNVKLSGTLEVVEGSRVRFVPMNLGNSSMGNFVSQVISALEFDLGLQKLPIPLDLKRIQILNGKIQALGGTQN